MHAPASCSARARRYLLLPALLFGVTLGCGTPSAPDVDATPSAQLLVGSDRIPSTRLVVTQGTAIADGAIAVRSGMSRSIRVFVDEANRADRISVAVYAGESGPEALLATASGAVTPGIWNELALEVEVVMGRRYWLSVLAPYPGGDGVLRGATAPVARNAIGGLSSMPEPWRAGEEVPGGPIALYLSQDSPVPPDGGTNLPPSITRSWQASGNGTASVTIPPGAPTRAAYTVILATTDGFTKVPMLATLNGVPSSRRFAYYDSSTQRLEFWFFGPTDTVPTVITATVAGTIMPRLTMHVIEITDLSDNPLATTYKLESPSGWRDGAAEPDPSPPAGLFLAMVTSETTPAAQPDDACAPIQITPTDGSTTVALTTTVMDLPANTVPTCGYTNPLAVYGIGRTLLRQ